MIVANRFQAADGGASNSGGATYLFELNGGTIWDRGPRSLSASGWSKLDQFGTSCRGVCSGATMIDVAAGR